MPHITSAMHKSVRRGVEDIFFDSLLGKRSITGEVSSVKNTFSSWDNCMAKTYCKWPVIAAIIIASLIVFSVLWCIIRCACCGMSCCCTCFSFLKCCDCCGGCCDGKKDKPHKHLDDPFAQSPPHQGYKAPAPMMGGALASGPPQYAQFEVGKNGLAVDPATKGLSEDALPPMPSWDTASKKHVLTEEEKNAVELGELDPTTGQKIPLMAGGAGTGISSPPSPANEFAASPYGAQPSQGLDGNSYMNIQSEQYAQNQNTYNQNGRGFGGPPGPTSRGRGYPQQGGPGRGYGLNPPQGMDNTGSGYGPPSPQDPYAIDNGFAMGGGYGRPQPQRQYTGDSNRPFPPPQRQYSNDSSHPLNPGRGYSERPSPGDSFQQHGAHRGPPRGPGGPGRLASPPLNNNSGFDFGTGIQPQPYSSQPSPPPQQYPSQQQMPYDSSYSNSRAPPTYASRTPPPEELAYPGYRPYQPPNQSRGPPRGTRGGREPENWDPVQR